MLLILACLGDPLLDSGTGDGGEDGGAADGGFAEGGPEEAVPSSALAPLDGVGTTCTCAGDPVTEQALARSAVGPGEYRGEVTLGTTWTSDWSCDWERDDGDSGSRSGTV